MSRSSVEVRGEVFMPKAGFEKLNAEARKAAEAKKAADAKKAAEAKKT